MRIFRALALGAGLILAGLALLAAQNGPAPSTTSTPRADGTAAATPVVPPAPTRAPLPTLAPPLIVSRVARATTTPIPTATPTSPAEPRVAVVDNGFSPMEMEIVLGASVAWTNLGGDGHDVTGTGPGGPWRSGPLSPRDSYRRPFKLVGEYDYVCTIHPEMRGRITVVQP